MSAVAMRVTEKSSGWIPNHAEEATKHIREGEVEDELEGELAELFEENVAEDYEARPDE